MRWNINRFFNPENRFWAFMERVTDICVLSFFWFLFSIPVVTAGAATTALFQYTLRLTADEEGYVWKTFREGFKKNFGQATILWIGAVIVGTFLVFDLWCCQFLAPLGAVRFFAFFLLIGAIFVYLLTIIYLFPLLAFFHVDTRKVIRDSFVMSVGNLHVSVTILVIYGITAVVTYFFPMLFMFWFALGSYVASFFYRFIFYKYIKDDEE